MTGRLAQLYGGSLALLTDLYQLTMAAGYVRHGLAEREAVFHLAFRRAPFDGQYAVAAGLADVVEFVENFRFADEDLAYLATLTGRSGPPDRTCGSNRAGAPAAEAQSSGKSQAAEGPVGPTGPTGRLFDDDFLDYLKNMRLSVDLHAVPEGTVVFGHEPLIRVRGPLLQCQLLETPLLTLVNFPTLIATKASRVCHAAGGDGVLEFGLRRAQGIDGGVTAARAAMIGGCRGTSNVLAGRLFDVPVNGTHAHSWIMTYNDEPAAFAAYAEAMPHNCILLVDTYDTLAGVANAIEVAKQLRADGHEMIGVRLDSGDLLELSIAARKLLNDAGFPDVNIVASNDLDEYEIARLKAAGAQINLWGVGTKLTTAYDQPALGGVYKLSAIADEHGKLQPRVKLSDDAIKVSNPGVLQVRRFTYEGQFVGDCIYDEDLGIDPTPTYLPFGRDDRHTIDTLAQSEDLLQPIFNRGHRVCELPTLPQIQAHAARQLHSLPDAVRRLENPRPLPVGLESSLFELKQTLIREATR